MRPNVRSPIIPLDFDFNVRAVRKELMIDYQKGDIYVVSADDPNDFICITNKIKNAILSIIYGGNNDITDISNCQIIIEGIGTYLVRDFLKIIWNNQIDAIPSPDINSVALRTHYYDQLSVGVQNNKVSLVGFEGSPNNYVPIKRGGMLQWLPLSEAQKPTADTPNRGGVYIVETTYDQDSEIGAIGKIGSIQLIEAVAVQRTIDLATKAMVYMPKTETEYCSIKWLINTIAGEDIYVTFDPEKTIYWEYENDSYMGEDMTAIYEFETFDNGQTWFGKRHVYGHTLEGADEYVTRKELYNNFYTKSEVVDFISWSYDIDDTDELPDGGNPNEGDIGHMSTGSCDCIKLTPASDAEVDSLFWNIDFVDDPSDDVELGTRSDIVNMFPEGTFTSCETCAIKVNTTTISDIQQMLIHFDQYKATGVPAMSDCGCEVQTSTSNDISTLINNPSNLETTTRDNHIVCDDCALESTNKSDIKNINNT